MATPWPAQPQPMPMQTPFPPAAAPMRGFPPAPGFVQTATSLPPVPQTPIMPGPAPFPQQAARQPMPRQSSSVQTLLLFLGVGMVTAAVVTFATGVYSAFGEIARAACIGALGLLAVIIARVIERRLRITAEGVAWTGFAALSIDAMLVYNLDALQGSPWKSLCGGLALLASAIIAIALRALPRRANGVRSDVHADASGDSSGNGPDNGHADSHADSHANGAAEPQSAQSAQPALPIRPLRAYGLYASLSLPWATVLIFDLPISRSLVHALSAIALGLLAAAGGLTASAFASRAQASALASETAPELKENSPERILLASVSMFLLMVLALSSYASSSPELPYVALGTYAIMLALMTAAWLQTATQPLQPTAGPAAGPIAAPAAVPMQQFGRTKRSAGPIAWIFGIIAGITAIGMLLLTHDGFTKPVPADLITAFTGLTALALGAHRMRLDPALRSWPALWPGLTFLLIPSLLMTWGTHASATSVRSLILLVVSLAVLLAGTQLGWQAPITMGATVLVLHVFTQLWPWIRLFSLAYWWVWLLAGGIILITAAARYEASINSMKRIGRSISQLR